MSFHGEYRPLQCGTRNDCTAFRSSGNRLHAAAKQTNLPRSLINSIRYPRPCRCERGNVSLRRIGQSMKS